MIKSPFPPKSTPKILQKCSTKKKKKSSSDHKSAKIFVNINNSCSGRVPTSGWFCKYSTLLVRESNL